MPTFRNRAERVKNRFISWDFVLSVLVTVLLFFTLPPQVHLGFALDLYVTGITVITMCIFYFLAFIALVASVSDSRFVMHLEKDRGIITVFNTYKYTVAVLFIALFVNLIMYGFVNYQKYIQPDVKSQSRFFFTIFLFFFVYGMLTVFEATLDSVDILKLRARFIIKRSADSESTGENSPED